jgi:hypothetical protein
MKRSDAMLFLGVVIFILSIVYVVVGGYDNKVYDEYCNLECWSRRKPCCRTS